MVETKCVHIDRAQADPNHKLASDHWQALVRELHDFFLASQHPFASPALRRLAAKYSMPARMWKHGIHSFFLEHCQVERDNIFRQVFLTELVEKARNSASCEEQPHTEYPANQQDPATPVIPESELFSKVNAQAKQPHFVHAQRLTYDTFALVLRRAGDKNVFPHVHIMLSFLTTFAAKPFVSHLLGDTPWNELVAFLNTLVMTESQIQSQSEAQNVTQPQNIVTLFSKLLGDSLKVTNGATSYHCQRITSFED
jgi:hypothetical protein